MVNPASSPSLKVPPIKSRCLSIQPAETMITDVDEPAETMITDVDEPSETVITVIGESADYDHCVG